MSFPAILVLATALTGAVWVFDMLFLAPRRRARAREMVSEGYSAQSEVIEMTVREPYLVDLSRSFFPVILIVLLIRSFLVEPFRIPSGSMMPTLLVGDFILVNKFSYGVRLPVLNEKVIDVGDPERGDVVVFRYPDNPSIDYIKRVVGVPGDRIVYRRKELYINGEQATQIHIGQYLGIGGGAGMTGAKHLQENLIGIQHDILVSRSRPDIDFEFEVPEDEYFVMGDNRDNSRDSRFWGTVPEQNLVGKAFSIWMNWDSDSEDVVDLSRIGSSIE